jgi:hypothetical protein
MSDYTGFKIVLSKGDNPDNFAVKQANFAPSEGFNPALQSNQAQRKNPNITGAIGVMLAKKALQYGISNYGNLTGDYIMQQKISVGVEAASTIALMATGPIGMAAALSSMAFQAITQGIEESKENTKLAFMRERTGALISNRGIK